MEGRRGFVNLCEGIFKGTKNANQKAIKEFAK